jgi:hypothetical protein
VALPVAPGQAHELPIAPGLLDRLPRVPRWVVGDRGYGSHAFRDLIRARGARPGVPTLRDEAAVACPAPIHTNRNLVERRLRARLKERHAIAASYGKTAASLMGVLCLAATTDRLRANRSWVRSAAAAARCGSPWRPWRRGPWRR